MEMSTDIATQRITTLVSQMPPDLQQEVEDFVQLLFKRRVQKPGKTLRQDWAGALKDYREQYTSLELQRKALEWRGD
ncbi:MAG: DUF2281 domain-containing protein [Chloroflexota bacterium]